MLLLLVIGGGLRLVRLSDPPLNFYPGRQYNTELVARWYYIATGGEVVGVSAEVAEKASPGLIEPPILQIASAGIYHVIGGENLLVPLVISVSAWLLGAGLLFLLARRLASETAGLISAAVYLFVPIAVFGSRVIQPDPMFVAAIVGALLAIVRHDDNPSMRRLVVAALASGAAVLIKLPALFFLFPVFGVVLIRREGWRPKRWTPAVIFAAIASLPAALYLIAGYALWGFLKGQETGRFLPQLWTRGEFWSAWYSSLTTLFAPVLYLAIFGVVLAKGRVRAVLLTLTAGYLGYGLFFPYHITSHTYYQLPLVPIVALATAALVQRCRDWLMAHGRLEVRRLASTVLTLAVGVAVLMGDGPLLAPPPLEGTLEWIDISAQAGEAVDHSTRVLMVAPANGDIFRFYGGVAGTVWPTSADLAFERQGNLAPVPVPVRFESLRTRTSADYVVVTWLAEWERQPELRALVEQRYPLEAQGEGFLVYDLRGSRS